MKSDSNSLHSSLMFSHAGPVSHDFEVYVFYGLYVNVDIEILAVRIEDEDSYTSLGLL